MRRAELCTNCNCGPFQLYTVGSRPDAVLHPQLCYVSPFLSLCLGNEVVVSAACKCRIQCLYLKYVIIISLDIG